MLKAVLARMPDLSIHPFNPVSNVSYSEPNATLPYTVTTSKGVIKARLVLHATNGYSSHLIKAFQGINGVLGVRGHMMAFQPPKDKAIRQVDCGIGYALMFHYLFQRPNNGPFLYGYGGASKITDELNDNVTIPEDSETKQAMYKYLRESMHDWFGQNPESCVVNDWTGVLGITRDGASIVGRPDMASPGEFCSVGFNGQGMTRCFSSAKVITDRMLSYLKGDPWARPDWYPESFTRNIQ